MNPWEHSSNRQPMQDTWLMELFRECHAWVLGGSLECSTSKAYASAFLSYTSFCEQHLFPIQPSADTLSFYIIYMSHHIQLLSVKSYLSGICAELEGFWPDIHEIHSSQLVTKMLAGCIKLLGQPTHWKCALSEQDLHMIQHHFPPSPSHNDLLFLAIVFTGWHCLLQLGELVCLDSVSLRNNQKNISHHSVKQLSLPHPHISFFLPMHKADHLWEGSTIVLNH